MIVGNLARVTSAGDVTQIVPARLDPRANRIRVGSAEVEQLVAGSTAPTHFMPAAETVYAGKIPVMTCMRPEEYAIQPSLAGTNVLDEVQSWGAHFSEDGKPLSARAAQLSGVLEPGRASPFYSLSEPGQILVLSYLREQGYHFPSIGDVSIDVSAEELDHLVDAVEQLSHVPTSFWASPGEHTPAAQQAGISIPVVRREALRMVEEAFGEYFAAMENTVALVPPTGYEHIESERESGLRIISLPTDHSEQAIERRLFDYGLALAGAFRLHAGDPITDAMMQVCPHHISAWEAGLAPTLVQAQDVQRAMLAAEASSPTAVYPEAIAANLRHLSALGSNMVHTVVSATMRIAEHSATPTADTALDAAEELRAIRLQARAIANLTGDVLTALRHQPGHGSRDPYAGQGGADGVMEACKAIDDQAQNLAKELRLPQGHSNTNSPTLE